MRWRRWFRRLRADPPAEATDHRSLVLLLRRPLPVREGDLLPILDRQYAGRFLPRNDDCFVVGHPEGGPVMIKSTMAGMGGFFFISWGTTPYIDPAIIDHQAAIAMVMMDNFGDERGAYGFMGRLLEAMAPADTVGLYHDPSRTALPYGSAVVAALQGTDVLSALGIGGGAR